METLQAIVPPSPFFSPPVEPVITGNAREVTGDDMKEAGASVVHVFDPTNVSAGGVTIVYRDLEEYPYPSKGTRMLEVATAWCAQGDAYNRKMGLSLATTRLLAGNCTVMRVHGNPSLFLQGVFSYACRSKDYDEAYR